jgi:hypothetical protein
MNSKKALLIINFLVSVFFCRFGLLKTKRMKVIFITTLLFISSICVSQNKEVPELNCFNKWAAKFEDRGAEDIKDGLHDDVIITVRQGAKASCSNGKAVVREGMVTQFHILLSDGSYEEVKKTWKNKSNENVNIVNGMSRSLITVHGELINILWPSKIKPKKAKPSVAPDPTDD